MTATIPVAHLSLMKPSNAKSPLLTVAVFEYVCARAIHSRRAVADLLELDAVLFDNFALKAAGNAIRGAGKVPVSYGVALRLALRGLLAGGRWDDAVTFLSQGRSLGVGLWGDNPVAISSEFISYVDANDVDDSLALWRKLNQLPVVKISPVQFIGAVDFGDSQIAADFSAEVYRKRVDFALALWSEPGVAAVSSCSFRACTRILEVKSPSPVLSVYMRKLVAGQGICREAVIAWFGEKAKRKSLSEFGFDFRQVAMAAIAEGGIEEATVLSALEAWIGMKVAQGGKPSDSLECFWAKEQAEGLKSPLFLKALVAYGQKQALLHSSDRTATRILRTIIREASMGLVALGFGSDVSDASLAT
jgi:hypothetical protein